MEESNKVIVFEKKEIIIILLFVILLIIASFTLGIRLGKKISLDKAGITSKDTQSVELRSAIEEDADKSVEQDSNLTDEEKLKKLMNESKERLSDELTKFSTENPAPASAAATTAQGTEAPKDVAPTSTMTGKYTIQLGSYNTVDEARQFAEGFTVRGYNPIINEVKIQGKGNWYRVSLGLFNTVEEAKGYIKAEQSLFSGQDHIITEIK